MLREPLRTRRPLYGRGTGTNTTAKKPSHPNGRNTTLRPPANESAAAPCATAGLGHDHPKRKTAGPTRPCEHTLSDGDDPLHADAARNEKTVRIFSEKRNTGKPASGDSTPYSDSGRDTQATERDGATDRPFPTRQVSRRDYSESVARTMRSTLRVEASTL